MKKIEYKVQTVDIHWIQKLDSYSNGGRIKYPRTPRTSQINMLMGLLAEGKFWDTPIVVNIIYDNNNTIKTMHVIDGCHRIEAYKRHFENPKFKYRTYQQQLAIYKNLSEAEERKIYERWSLGVKQSLSDWVQINQVDVHLWQKINNDDDFPARVTLRSSGRETICFDLIYFALGSSLSSNSKYYPNKPIFSQLYNYNCQMNSYIKDRDVYEKLKRFIRFFVRQFGTVGKDNIWQKSNLFYPILDIYFKNCDKIHDQKTARAFSRVMGNKTIMEKGRLYSDRKMKCELRIKMIEIMNRVKVGKFV